MVTRLNFKLSPKIRLLTLSICMLGISTLINTTGSAFYCFAESAPEMTVDKDGGKDYRLTGSVPMKAALLTTDFMKNAYVVTKNNQVMKYDSTGTLVARFSDSKFGQISHVDATAPFNVLIFFKDQARVVTTDMRLNVKRSYKLSSVGINEVSAACMSHDNYMWIFDQADNKLKKITDSYEIIHESLSIVELLGMEITPSYMVERGNMIYMNVPDLGVMVFDMFGTYYTSISNSTFFKEDIGQFQVVNNKIVYFHEGYVHIYDAFTREPESIPIPKSRGLIDVRLEKGNLFMLNESELQFYNMVR